MTPFDVLRKLLKEYTTSYGKQFNKITEASVDFFQHRTTQKIPSTNRDEDMQMPLGDL